MTLDKTIVGTKKLSPEQLAADPSRRRAAVSLLVYHRDGTSTHALIDGQPLVIGRHPPRDGDHPESTAVEIPDDSLSREHARFELIGTEVWVEDLGSTNGTRINGEATTGRQRVNAGDEVLLGSVCVSIHALAPLRRAAGLDNHDQFERLLDHEVRRCRCLGGQLGLLMIEHVGESPIGRWFPKLQGTLRSMDVAGAYSPKIVEVLLPEASDRFALDVARKALGALGSEFRCGVAGYPWAASSADELLGVCLQAQHGCTAASPIRRAADQSVGEPPEATASNDQQPIVLCPQMRELYRLVHNVARSDISVLIHGETGAGKELVARAIHRNSSRSDRKLCCLNCGAIPEQLAESALLGHERGAFTGADQQRPGVFERAAGGTVFLDEVGELPSGAQVALLRVLEQKVLTRVGGTAEIPVDVRVVSATHQDLEAMCQAKTFRLDLFYRLNTMVLELPPLRERREELEALAHHFLVLAGRQNRRPISGFTPEALGAMRRHTWPGNVRELRNAVERAVVIAAGNAITLDDLPAAIRRLGSPPAPAATGHSDGGQPVGIAQQQQLFESDLDFKTRVQRFEADLIERAYRACGYNKSETSRRLRIPLRTLINKLQQYHINKS